MTHTYANDPYFRGAATWEHHGGRDVYMRKTWCPYCGRHERDEVTAYDHMWRTLRCGGCGKTYRVK